MQMRYSLPSKEAFFGARVTANYPPQLKANRATIISNGPNLHLPINLQFLSPSVTPHRHLQILQAHEV